MSEKDFILYGIRASLYTGKARAYMRRNRIPVTERKPRHPDYTGRIIPKVQRLIIPVLETPDGKIIQDGTDILDYLESEGLGIEPLYPDSPILKSISLLFELFGNEGLLRPAMHFRWNFDDENIDFLKHSFSDFFPAAFDENARQAAFDHASGRMRKAANAFGVFPHNLEAIEKSYFEFLSLFNDHLKEHSFLLGSKPTIGDYGLFNPLYAHLARDPKPSHIMKTQAPHVWNWIERMNAPEQSDPLNPDRGQIDPESLPETLVKLLSYVGEEFAAEFSAHVDFTNVWLTENKDPNNIKKGPLGGRVIGFTDFQWRDQKNTSAVFHYRFYLAQRQWDHFDGCAKSEQVKIRKIFSDAGLSNFLDKRTSRAVIRKDHLEVWDD